MRVLCGLGSESKVGLGFWLLKGHEKPRLSMLVAGAESAWSALGHCSVRCFAADLETSVALFGSSS